MAFKERRQAGSASERTCLPSLAHPVMPDVLDPFFTSYYRLRPVNATFTGIHDDDGELPDWSPAGLDGSIAEMRGLRTTLSPTGNPGTVAEADEALADAYLDIQIAEREGAHFQRGNPALWTGEAIFGLIGLMLRAFAPAPQRAASLAARLRHLPAFLEAADGTLRHPVPPPWRERAERECDAAIRLLDHGLPTWADTADLPTNARTALSAAQPGARRAFETFRARMSSLPASGPDRGCGEELYALLLRRGHWCADDARTLLGRAETDLAAAEDSLTEMLRNRGCDWNAVETELAAAHPPLDGYLAHFGELWTACRTAVQRHALLTWPEFPLEYVPIPRWARGIAPDLYFLFYRSPAPFDPTPPQYLVPPVDGLSADRQAAVLRSVNSYVIKTNHVVHHGAVGHHVQNANAYRSTSRIGRVAAVDCASRIGMFGGGSLAEGWACYATDLMEEVGFLNEVERIAHQHGRVRQLLRAILDVRVHVDALPLAEAVEIFARGTGVPRPAAEREITRLSMFPGTSIMYWLGTEAIHALRRRQQERKGTAFTLRGFHDTFLTYGAMPVHLIGHLMQGAST